MLDLAVSMQRVSRPQQHSQQAAVQSIAPAALLNLQRVQRPQLMLLVNRHPRTNMSQNSSSYQLMSKLLKRRTIRQRQSTALCLQTVQQQKA
jgi:hypothetical protein